MNGSPLDKAALRRVVLRARKKAHDGALAEPLAHLAAAIRLPEGGIVAGYMPIRSEIDPLPTMRLLHNRGLRVCVPVIRDAGLPLDFRIWSPDVDLIDGPFGAAVPATGDWAEPEVLIVPMVGFDARLNRLGYGGGFYDRTLEQLRAKRPTRAIGLAYDAQEVPALPVEPTDQPLDLLVTPTRVLS